MLLVESDDVTWRTLRSPAVCCPVLFRTRQTALLNPGTIAFTKATLAPPSESEHPHDKKEAGALLSHVQIISQHHLHFLVQV